MKKIVSLILSLMVAISLVGCGNNKTLSIVKSVETKIASITDENAYIKVNNYKLNSDGTITWNVNFLQDTQNIGDVFIKILIYDKDGNPIKYHKPEVDPITNASFDQLQLIKDKEYPINQSYDFKSAKNTLIDYAKIKYCVDVVYHKDDKGNWVSWKNLNLNNWIKVNNNKY